MSNRVTEPWPVNGPNITFETDSVSGQLVLSADIAIAFTAYAMFPGLQATEVSGQSLQVVADDAGTGGADADTPILRARNPTGVTINYSVAWLSIEGAVA